MKTTLALLLCSLALQVNAQSSATDERIRLLEAQILQLNGRVSALEGMLAVNAAEQHLKDAWSETLGVSFAPYFTINRPSE